MNNNTSAASLAHQTNPIEPGYHDEVRYDTNHTLATLAAAGGHISRLRLLTDVIPGRGRVADISYCHGQLPDGSIHSITVNAPRWSLIPLRQLKGTLIEWAREEGVNAKRLGLLDEGNWSTLY